MCRIFTPVILLGPTMGHARTCDKGPALTDILGRLWPPLGWDGSTWEDLDDSQDSPVLSQLQG